MWDILAPVVSKLCTTAYTVGLKPGKIETAQMSQFPCGPSTDMSPGAERRRSMDLLVIYYLCLIQAFRRELEWSSHLSLPAVLIELKSERCYNLARALYEHTMGLANMQVLM